MTKKKTVKKKGERNVLLRYTPGSPQDKQLDAVMKYFNESTGAGAVTQALMQITKQADHIKDLEAKISLQDEEIYQLGEFKNTFRTLLEQFGLQIKEKKPAPKKKVCPECGSADLDSGGDGLYGCGNCFETFKL